MKLKKKRENKSGKIGKFWPHRGLLKKNLDKFLNRANIGLMV